VTLELYLDPAGATPLAPAAREAVVAALDTYGDPLMIHAPGRAARVGTPPLFLPRISGSASRSSIRK